MRIIRLPQANGYIKKHKNLSIWYKLLISMASMVVFLTTYMLILPAITMEYEVVCGKQAHTHTEECYETILVLECEFSEGDTTSAADEVISDGAVEETEGEHIHGDECYVEKQILTCELEEHIHTDECYAEIEEEKENSGGSGSAAEPLPQLLVENTKTEQALKDDLEQSQKESISLKSDFESYSGGRPPRRYSVSAKNTTYDSVSNSYDSTLKIDFTTSRAEIIENNNTFVYKVPEEVDIDITKIELGKIYTNYEGDAEKFDYKFELGDDGFYYVIAEFREEYLDEIEEDSAVTGFIEVEVLIGNEAAGSDGSIYVEFGEDIVLEIPKDEIEYPENSSSQYDLYANKSASYDSTASTITYKVVIYSRKGTPDTFEFYDKIADLKGLTIEDCQVTVQQGEQYVYDNAYLGNLNTTNDTLDITPVVNLETGEISMTLPGLGEESGDGVNYELCEAYLVTYTYTVSGLDEGESVSLSNEVEVSAESELGTDISSSSSVSTTIKNLPPSMLTKSVVRSGATITWTLRVGDGETDLAGSVLTDTMLSELTASDVNISPADSNVVIYSDEDGKVTGIEFSEGCNSQYTITYSTQAKSWNASTVTNTATLTDSEGGTTGATSSISGVQGGSVRKSNAAVKSENADGTKTLEWEVTFTIPEGGVPAMTVTDYLESTDKGHYMSYSDAQSLISALTEGDEAWCSKIGNIKFKASDGTWYNAADITSDMVLVEFSYDILETIYPSDCGSGNTLTYAYTTTADTSGQTESVSYRNGMSVPGVWVPTAEYYYNKRVTKTDGKDKVGDTATTTTNGEVVWKVRVNVETDDFDEMSIIDSLPEEVELTKLEISYANYNYAEIPIDSSTTFNGLQVEASVDSDNKVTVDLSALDSSTRPDMLSENGVIYLRYTCKIKDELITGGTTESFELNNTVEVLTDNESYADTSQKQTVTVDKSEVIKAPVEKSQNWIKDGQKISCSVELNPYGEQYGDGEFFEFIDTLTYKSGTDESTSTSHRRFDLEVASLKLYYAVPETYTDDEGRVNTRLVKGDLVDPADWSFVYDTESSLSGDYYNNKNVITAQFPDEIPLIFEYSYLLDFEARGYDTGIGATNEAFINSQIIGNSHKVTSTDNWESAGTSAGVTKGPTYTLYKVTHNNFNSRIPGAVFELYAYDAGTGKYASTGKQFVTDSDGLLEVRYNRDGLSYNTMYYLVEVQPPEGYALPEITERLYFYVSNSESEIDNMPDTMPNDAIDLAVDAPVKFMSNELIEDTSLEVDKKWYNANGEETEPGADVVTFNVLRKYLIREDMADKDITKVDYTISGSWGNTQLGEFSAVVGSQVDMIVTCNFDIAWRPGITATLGSQSVNVAESDLSSWDDNTYTYRFAVEENMSAEINVSTAMDDFSVEFVPVKEEVSESSYINDAGFCQSYSLSESNSWTQVVDDLPVSGLRTLSNGTVAYVDYVYYVEEALQLDDYETTYEKSDNKITIKNTFVDKSVITVIKKWFNADGSETTKATGEVSFGLYKKIVEGGSGPVDVSYNISASNDWDLFSATESFEAGSVVNLVISHSGVWWWPALDIQVGSHTITTQDYNSTGWVLDTANSVSTYTYQFVVDESTKNITGRVGGTYKDIGIDLVLVSSPDSDGTSEDAVLATELVGNYKVEGPEWITKIDVTSLPKSGTYTKADGTTVAVSYLYYIEEAPLSGYTTSYENNDGIVDGTITINNTSTGENDVSLPETGGTGTNPYTLGGLLILLFAVCLWYKNAFVKGGNSL